MTTAIATDGAPQLDWLQASAQATRTNRERRELGARRAAARAESQVSDFVRRAAAYLGSYARDIAHGQPFLVEDAREIAPLDLRPREPRAWGRVPVRAAELGLIKRASNPDGTKRFGTGRVNCSPKPMWIAA